MAAGVPPPASGRRQRWSAGCRASISTARAFMAQFPGATIGRARAVGAAPAACRCAPQRADDRRRAMPTPSCAALVLDTALPAQMTDGLAATFLQSSLSAAAPAGARRRLGLGGVRRRAGRANYRNLLVLIELQGRQRRPQHRRPLRRSDVLRVASEARDRARRRAAALGSRRTASGARRRCCRSGRNRELAVLQGIRLPRAEPVAFSLDRDLGHGVVERGTISPDGWLTRAFAASPAPRAFAADGVVIGSNDLGPLAGGGTRAVALSNTEAFLRQARLAAPGRRARATRPTGTSCGSRRTSCRRRRISTRATRSRRSFRQGGFGNAIRTACQIIANPSGVAVVRLSLPGFDTHGGADARRRRACSASSRGASPRSRTRWTSSSAGTTR